MFSINLQINQSESLDYCYLLDDGNHEYFDVTYLECCNGEQENCNFPSTVPAPKNCEWIPLAYIRPQFVPAEYKTITVETRLDSGINDDTVFLHATFDSDIEVAEINGMPVVGQVATTAIPASATNISIRLRSKVGKFVRGVISYTFQTDCIQNQNATFLYGGNEISLFKKTDVTLNTEKGYTLPLSFESFQNNNWNDIVIVFPHSAADPNIYGYNRHVDQDTSTIIFDYFVTIPTPYNQWINPIITSLDPTYSELVVFDENLQVRYTGHTSVGNTNVGWGLIRNRTKDHVNFTADSTVYDIIVQFVNETTIIVAKFYILALNTENPGNSGIIVETYDIATTPPLLTDTVTHPCANCTGDVSAFLRSVTCGDTVYFYLYDTDYFRLLVTSKNMSHDINFFTPSGLACFEPDNLIYVNENTVKYVSNDTTITKLIIPTGFSYVYDFQATEDFLCALWAKDMNDMNDDGMIMTVHILFQDPKVQTGSIVKEITFATTNEDANSYVENPIMLKNNVFYATSYVFFEDSSLAGHLNAKVFILQMPESKENVSSLSFTAYTGNASDLSTPTLTLISSDDSDIQITITYIDGNLTLTQPDGTVGQNQAISGSEFFDIVRTSDGTFTLSDTGNFSLNNTAPPASLTASNPSPPLHTVSIGPRSIVDWNKAQENEIACLPTNEQDQECIFEYTFAELDATKGWNITLTLQRRLCSARYSMHLVNSVPENFVIQKNVWSYTMQVGECIDIISGSARISTGNHTLAPIPGNWTLGNFSSLCTTNNSNLQTIYTCSNEPSLREYIIKSDCALYWDFSGLQSVNHDSTQCIWYGIGDFTGILLSPGNVNVDDASIEIYYRSTGPFLGVGTQLAKVPAQYKNIPKTGDTFPWTAGKEDGFIVSDANISFIEVNGTTTYNCPTSNSNMTLFLYSDLGNVAPPSIIYLSLGPTEELSSLMVRPWFQWEGVEASGLPVNCAYKV